MKDELKRGLTEATVAIGYGLAIIMVLALTYHALQWLAAVVTGTFTEKCHAEGHNCVQSSKSHARAHGSPRALQH